MKITEDSNNIYIENYIIPKGTKKEDLKAREKLSIKFTAFGLIVIPINVPTIVV
jgi:hypothetical protein